MNSPANKTVAAGFGLVLLLALIPLFAVSVPPLHDYPFHLARADILHSLPGSAFLRDHYEQGSFLLPNVGMDVVMAPLARYLPILIAGRVFLGLVLTVMLSGTVALHFALHRRLSAWPLLAGFFLYNWIFHYGFLNYLLGVGLMLWAVAGWIALRERPVAWRLAWGIFMAVVLLFCHLVAVGLFAIVVVGMELQRASRTLRTEPAATVRNLVLSAVPFVFVLAVFAAVSPTAGEARQVIAYHGGIGWKPLVAYRGLLTTSSWLDAVTLTPVLALVVFALWRRRLHVAFPMGLPLLLLIAAFMAMPFHLFGAEFADARLPPAILLVAIAGTQVTGIGRRAGWLVGLGALGLLALRSAAITVAWIAADTRLAALTDAIRLVPDGATLYAATAAPYPSIDYRDAAGLALWQPPLKHAVSLASLGRDIFVPVTWSDPFKQPMRVAAALAPIKQFQTENPFKTTGAAELNTVVAGIAARHRLLPANGAGAVPPDHLLLLYPNRFHGDLPAGSRTLARGADFVLLRLP